MMSLVKSIIFTSFILSGIFVCPSLASEIVERGEDLLELHINSGTCDPTGLSWELYQKDNLLSKKVAGTYNETEHTYIEDVRFNEMEGCLKFTIYDSNGTGMGTECGEDSFYGIYINSYCVEKGGRNEGWGEESSHNLCYRSSINQLKDTIVFILNVLGIIRETIADTFIIIAVVYLVIWVFFCFAPIAAIPGGAAAIHPVLSILLIPCFLPWIPCYLLSLLLFLPGAALCLIGWTISPQDLPGRFENYISWLQDEEKDIPLDVFFHD